MGALVFIECFGGDEEASLEKVCYLCICFFNLYYEWNFLPHQDNDNKMGAFFFLEMKVYCLNRRPLMNTQRPSWEER